MTPLNLATPDFCGCCAGQPARTPVDIFNRPGLSAIAYRVGTYGSFRQAMLEAIAAEPRLSDLSTRESSDYTITLIELFAAMGDVLTFYNERIANELFLRTAVHRDSVARMARMIGYRARPGLSAKTMLSFTLDPGAVTIIKPGLKAMSTPGQDERALTFETLEQLTADARLNALPVFAPPVPVNPLGDGRTHAPVLARPERLSRGERIALYNQARLDSKEVVDLERRADGERLHFSAIAGAFPPGGGFCAKVLRGLNLFAHDAPDSATYYDANPAIPATQRWKTDTPDPAIAAHVAEYPLDRKISDLRTGAAVLVDRGVGAPRYQTATVAGLRDGVASYGVARRETVTFVALRETIRGRPALAFVAGAGLRAFARSGAGTVLALDAGAGSAPFEPLVGFTATSDPAAVSWGAGRVDLFARDGAGATRHNAWTGAWGGWANLGGVATSRPVVVSNAPNELWLFVRGLDFALWFRRLQAGVWSAWTSLGGVLASAPVAVASGAGHVDVFARGLDRALWRRAWTPAGWRAWESIDGDLVGEPAVATTAPDRLDVAALDGAGMLAHRRFDGAKWNAWTTLDGPFVDAPALIQAGPDQMDIFTRRPDGGVRWLRRSGDTWSAGVTLEGGAACAPAPARGAGVALTLAARQSDGALALRAWNGAAWSAWTPAGGSGLGAIADRRRTRLFELDRTEIALRDYDYPEPLRGGMICARLDALGGLTAIDKGRRVLLDDGRRRALAQVTHSFALPALDDGPGHLNIALDPPIDLPMGATRLDGNIVEASHGETANPPDEPLGHGDAAKKFQSFTLRRAPLTYLGSGGAAGKAALDVRVNGELWREVESFFGKGPDERVYTLRQNEDFETTVTFGDGVTGARLASGAMNVVARYRTGLGFAGNLKAGQVSIPLERPVGLRGVSNPFAAEGGADAETGEDARRAAPTTVRTFGRAVSLEDMAWIATTSGAVARASATWVWRRLEKAIHLTVAGQKGARLSAEALKALHADLSKVRDANHPLTIANLNRVPLVVSAKAMRAPGRTADDVLAAARAAILDFFAFETMAPARAVHASQIMAVLQGADGVVAVDLDLFHLKGFAALTASELAARSVTSDAVQPHIRIYPARPTPDNPALIDRYARAAFENGVAPDVLPAEQAFIEDPAADIAIVIVEAL